MRLQWSKDPASGQMKMSEIAGSEFEMDCDLLLLAMGFSGPVKKGMFEELGVALDARGNVSADANKMTSVPGVFTAGDMTRGQSLVVWAIHEGRTAAQGRASVFNIEGQSKNIGELIMKKTLFILIALFALAGCQKQENQQQHQTWTNAKISAIN